METVPQQTYENVSRPNVARRAATYFMWCTVGWFQYEEAVRKVIVDEKNPEASTPEAIEKNQQDLRELAIRYRGPLQFGPSELAALGIYKSSSMSEEQSPG